VRADAKQEPRKKKGVHQFRGSGVAHRVTNWPPHTRHVQGPLYAMQDILVVMFGMAGDKSGGCCLLDNRRQGKKKTPGSDGRRR
jgi:hypothetical protein